MEASRNFMRLFKYIFAGAVLACIANCRTTPMPIAIGLGLLFLDFVGIGSLYRPPLRLCPVKGRQGRGAQ